MIDGGLFGCVFNSGCNQIACRLKNVSPGVCPLQLWTRSSQCGTCQKLLEDFQMCGSQDSDLTSLGGAQTFVVQSQSGIRFFFVTPWTVAHQAPLSMKFPRQEYQNGLSFPSPGNLLDPGTEPGSPALQVNSLPWSHHGSQTMRLFK